MKVVCLNRKIIMSNVSQSSKKEGSQEGGAQEKASGTAPQEDNAFGFKKVSLAEENESASEVKEVPFAEVQDEPQSVLVRNSEFEYDKLSQDSCSSDDDTVYDTDYDSEDSWLW